MTWSATDLVAACGSSARLSPTYASGWTGGSLRPPAGSVAGVGVRLQRRVLGSTDRSDLAAVAQQAGYPSRGVMGSSDRFARYLRGQPARHPSVGGVNADEHPSLGRPPRCFQANPEHTDRVMARSDHRPLRSIPKLRQR